MMVTTRHKPIEHYIEKMQAHLLKKFPHLEFEVVKYNDNEATVFYRPYREEEDDIILRRAGTIGMQAVADAECLIYIQPA